MARRKRNAKTVFGMSRRGILIATATIIFSVVASLVTGMFIFLFAFLALPFVFRKKKRRR